MRDLEFLPDWYPHARRRRRIVLLQGWMSVLAIAGMGMYLAMADHNIRIAERSMTALRGQLSQTEYQLAEMDKLELRLKQQRRQDQILQRIGLCYVESCTLVQTIEGMMPRQMSLSGVHFENEERVEKSAVLAARTGDGPVDRSLRVKLQGVCPTDVDLANFMTQLSAVPFFEQVNITYAREKSDSGHLMREFEITFTLNLNGTGS